MSGLVEKFQGIVDGYYAGSDDYKDVVDALTFMDEMKQAVQHDSLASDGLEMIQSVMRDMEREVALMEKEMDKDEEVRTDETHHGGTQASTEE